MSETEIKVKNGADDASADAGVDPQGGDPAPAGDLETARAEAAAAKEQALRYAAEAENTRRRAEREVNDARAYAISKFAKDLLAVADNLARALSHAPKDDQDPLARNLAIGLEMTQKDLLGAFERNGLKAISPDVGDRFDPHLHQAMTEQPSPTVAAGGVIEVLQTGYELFGRILRPALVVVAAKGSGAEAAEAERPARAGAAND
ncbi:MAG TPA: nucleotide exchange factor GrpE [Caulobacteraceae bacterium]|nr:nucleotide exchange factor GrpE [Caulobacteraceae bacterium]